LLVVIALVIAAPFVFRRAMTAYRTLQARTAADRQLRSYFKQCLTHTQSNAMPLFDETRDSCPILLDTYTAHGDRISEKYIRFRGDAGLEWPNDDWPRRRYAVYEPQTTMWSLSELNCQTAAGRHRCALQPLGMPPWVQVYNSDFGCLQAERYDLFVHGRSARGGPERLVVMSFDASTFLAGNPKPISIGAYSAPQTLLRGCSGWGMTSSLGFPCAPSEPLQLFAGQPDALDSSHFTIRYVAGKRHGVIDGWLRRDDSVALSAHEISQ
jgi:hypothetical protein